MWDPGGLRDWNRDRTLKDIYIYDRDTFRVYLTSYLN